MKVICYPTKDLFAYFYKLLGRKSKTKYVLFLIQLLPPTQFYEHHLHPFPFNLYRHQCNFSFNHQVVYQKKNR